MKVEKTMKKFFKYSNIITKELNNYFKVLGFNFDDKGKKFVSMVEAK